MARRILLGVMLGGIILLAAIFRLHDIQRFPPGLWPDVAANGEDALLILQGDWRPFYERGNGREGLFFYLDALSIGLFGIGVWPMYIPSAVVGTLTVGAIYFATRPWFGRLAGGLAALLLATSYWHVTVSRTGFRAILLPFFMAAFTACVGYMMMALQQKHRRRSYGLAALAGIFFGGGFYTYIASRMMVGVVIGMAVVWLLAALHPKIGWPHVARYARHIVIGVCAAGIVLTPLVLYFAWHPEAVVGRAGQVSVFNPELQRSGGVLPTIEWSLEKTLLALFAGTGDLNWRHSVAGYPLLNPLVGVLFLLGLVWVVGGLFMVGRKIIRGEELHISLIFPYLLLLFGGMLVPIITTAEGIPHGLRSVGLILPIFMIAGTAAAVIGHWLVRQPWRAGAIGVAAGVLFAGAWYDGLLYFVVARATPEAWAAYRADLTQVSQWLSDYRAHHEGARQPYLVLDVFSEQTVHFLTHSVREGAVFPPPHDYQYHPDIAQHTYRIVDPAMSHLLDLEPGDYVVFTQSTLAEADRYGLVHPEVSVVASVRNRFDQEMMRVYYRPSAGQELVPVKEPPEPAGLDA